MDLEHIFPWDRLRDWIYCFAVISFDIELGQIIELIYPSHVKLSDEEKSNICYLAFPDSNSGCMGDTQFHFRIRHVPSKMDLVGTQHLLNSYNQKCPFALQIDLKYMYGYVYFRQVRNQQLRRGYFQKSIVCLSKFPFINLFSQMMSTLAPEYFKNGVESIELACHNVYQWPNPEPGQLLNLPFLSTLFQVLIPSVTCLRPITNGSPVKSPTEESKEISIKEVATSSTLSVISSVNEPDLFQCLRQVLGHLHLLWELSLIGEPIVVMAPLPNTVSSCVHALTSMIYPLKYAADYRPYFTIHDTDFKEYTMKSCPPPPIILGVTNPFFAKTLQHWPHIIRLGGDQGNVHAGKLKKASNIKLIDSEPGVYTSYKPFLQKDKLLLKKIVAGMQSQRPSEVQTAILRRHLHELTESFMIPLERYNATLMPLAKNVCPLRAAPLPRPFNPDDFLATLEHSGPQLTTGIKGDWPGLYRKFFRSINFSEWYNLRYKEASDYLRALHLELISESDVQSWVKNRDEVEAVDLVLRLREQIAESNFTIKTSVKEKLKSQVESILNTLPDDLHHLLKAKN